MSSSSSSEEEWSPFYCLPKATLTASGLLQLDHDDNEVELLRRSSCIELRHDGMDPMGPCPKKASGPWCSRTSTILTVTVTTHRLVLTASSGSQANDSRFVHLSNVHVLQATGGPSFTSPRATYKLIVSTYTYGDIILVVSNDSSRPKEIRDALQTQVEKAMARKQWEQATRLQQQQKQQDQQTRRKVGVDHILTKHKLRHEQASKLADTALSGDAEQLLTQAGELLQVIQKYTVLLQKYQSSDNKTDDDAAQQLAGLLSDMGMTSALTKESFGGGKHGDDEYYDLMARQIADFLLPRFEKQIQSGKGTGGIMSLTDVYCLFNRARGTNLVSPEDMRQACARLGDLNVGLSQRIFPSGVIVIQLDKLALGYDDDSSSSKKTTMGKTIVKLCPTTAMEASHALKLSPLLAMEQLEEAERLGLICRDVTLETVRFYPNKFMTAGW